MAGASKRRQEIVSKVDREKAYEVNAALGLVKELATAKFKESIDISVNLGVRTRVNQIRLFVVLRFCLMAPERRYEWRFLLRAKMLKKRPRQVPTSLVLTI